MSLPAKFISFIPLDSLFQRLPGVITLLFLPFIFLGPAYTPHLYTFYYYWIHSIFLISNLKTLFGSANAFYSARKHSLTNWECKSDVVHSIIIPQYKEEMGTMFETLDCLSSHPLAKTSYRVTIHDLIIDLFGNGDG
jgi:cellulose synthase/poly-beta-1,6-N-acetylglucosamine synthase-like glycosyltransferase